MNFDIEKLKTKLLIKYPGFATVIANMNFIPSYGCMSNGMPTAATDGENFVYHPDFMNSLSLEQQLFVAAHEVSHIALNHIKRSEGKDSKIWNKATDAVINDQLKKDGLQLVEGGFYIEGASNYDAETLYNKLLEEKNKNNSSNNQRNNSNNNSSNNNQNSSNNNGDNNSNEYCDVGHDTHKMWEDAVKKSKEKNSSEGTQVEKEQKENTELGEKKVFEKNREVRKENLKKLRENLVKQSSGYGDNTTSTYIQLGDIGKGSALIKWQTLLRNTVNSKIDWSYKNATIEDGVVTSHLEDLSVPETEILLDTSGSVNDELLRNFLRECKGILNTSHIKVGCFDTRFYGFTEIKRESDIDNMGFQGRGGTNFNAAISAFTKRVDNKIIFTDGEAPMPEEAMDVIWIVYGNKKINPKGGKVIYIDKEQLNSLKYINDLQSEIKIR